MIQFITLCWLVLSFNLNASSTVHGSFEASRACPAFISKNKQTQVQKQQLKPGSLYTITQINKVPADWLRVDIPGSGQRWVRADCGVIRSLNFSNSRCTMNPGLADSHILALSSQPGFCETYGYEAGKPECLKLDKNSYQATHLTLHGLWPNQAACGPRYGYCTARPRPTHCSYPPLALDAEVAQQLKILMPAYQHGSCLERHEWNKHGSCQRLSADDYFSLSMRLTREFDQSAFGQYLTEHNGEVVLLPVLRQVLAQTYGKANLGKIYFSCKNTILVDIYIELPALIPFNESLATLIEQAPDVHHRDSCARHVTLSNFNHKSLF